MAVRRWWARYGTLLVVSLGLILFFNLLFAFLLIIDFAPTERLYRDGLIVRIPSLHYAMVFAHGGYITETFGENNLTYHAMEYHGQRYSTMRVVHDLRRQGYTRIWGSWCGSGDHDYVARLELWNGTVKERPWPEYVSRNTKPGPTMPVFVGIGFVRLPATGWMLDTVQS